MRISDWSSDVCSSDLLCHVRPHVKRRWQLWGKIAIPGAALQGDQAAGKPSRGLRHLKPAEPLRLVPQRAPDPGGPQGPHPEGTEPVAGARSEEHTSELQSLMRIPYAVFCLKKKKHNIKSQYRRLTLKTQKTILKSENTISEYIIKRQNRIKN